MNNINNTPGHEVLVERLSALEITLAKSPDGLLTVYTNSEPAFCYDGYNANELSALVADTLRSYARLFYGIDNFHVATEDEPLPEPPLPVERVEVRSRLRPVFDLAA
jgi:hypothetical protein